MSPQEPCTMYSNATRSTITLVSTISSLRTVMHHSPPQM